MSRIMWEDDGWRAVQGPYGIIVERACVDACGHDGWIRVDDLQEWPGELRREIVLWSQRPSNQAAPDFRGPKLKAFHVLAERFMRGVDASRFKELVAAWEANEEEMPF